MCARTEDPTLNATHTAAPPAPARRWYAPDYRRRLREAGAFRALTASAQVVLAALCDRANAAGVAWPTVETIARDHGLGESTVRRALGELVAAGLVLAARRNGRVTKYALVAPRESMAPVAPEQDPSQIGPPPLSNRAPIMIRDQIQNHEEQHDSAEPNATVVVVEEETTRENAAASPPAEGSENGDTIALLTHDLVERARAVGLAPAKVNRYGADRVRWVLDALDAERTCRLIGNPAGWALQALKENWALPGAIVQRALPFAALASAASRPPEGTRWARLQGDEDLREVLDVDDARAQLADATVVPAHHWDRWEWFVEPPADVPEASRLDKVGPEPADAMVDPEKRAALARVTAWAAIRPRAAAELAAKLATAGVTLDEWEAYRAAQAWLAANP